MLREPLQEKWQKAVNIIILFSELKASVGLQMETSSKKLKEELQPCYTRCQKFIPEYTFHKLRNMLFLCLFCQSLVFSGEKLCVSVSVE